ncbi:hypothetical protein [uncultured Prevotella sp.]|nr:hypothetical protein [uncultured Prevotella sp.]
MDNITTFAARNADDRSRRRDSGKTEDALRQKGCGIGRQTDY